MTTTPARTRKKIPGLKHLSRRIHDDCLRPCAGVWSIVTAALLKLASLLTTAIVAHILDPHDFGVFAVAMTAYGIVTTIGELGLGSCLIRADLDIDSLAPTMVTVSVATNALEAGAMIAFGRKIATALGSADAAGPIRVMALVDSILVYSQYLTRNL